MVTLRTQVQEQGEKVAEMRCRWEFYGHMKLLWMQPDMDWILQGSTQALPRGVTVKENKWQVWPSFQVKGLPWKVSPPNHGQKAQSYKARDWHLWQLVCRGWLPCRGGWKAVRKSPGLLEASVILILDRPTGE